MLKRIKTILGNASYDELKCMYDYIYKGCCSELSHQDIEDHILAYFQTYLKWHKKNAKMLTKCFIMISWFEYLESKQKESI